MMSLANTSSTDIGQSTLNQVNEFLMSSMNPSNIGGEQGELLLFITQGRRNWGGACALPPRFWQGGVQKLYRQDEVDRWSVICLRLVT